MKKPAASEPTYSNVSEAACAQAACAQEPQSQAPMLSDQQQPLYVNLKQADSDRSCRPKTYNQKTEPSHVHPLSDLTQFPQSGHEDNDDDDNVNCSGGGSMIDINKEVKIANTSQEDVNLAGNNEPIYENTMDSSWQNAQNEYAERNNTNS